MKARNRQEAALADAVRESITLMTGQAPRRAPSIWPPILLWAAGILLLLFAGCMIGAQAAHALALGAI